MGRILRLEVGLCAFLFLLPLIALHFTDARAGDGVCLAEPLRFADGTVSGCIGPQVAEALMDRAVALGDNRNVSGVSLTSPADMAEQKRVTSCREYQAATTAGWYALSTADLSMESFLIRECRILAAIASAGISARSYINTPRVGLSDLKWLSASTVRHLTVAKAGAESVADLVQAGTLKVITRSANRLRLSGGGLIADFHEIARGDFNRDGTEDILVFVSTHGEGGTLRGYETLILSRRSVREPLAVVP